MNYIGAHVSAAGGVHKAPLNVKQIGASAFALFTKNQCQWAAQPLTEEEIQRFRASYREAGYAPEQILPHDSYLISREEEREELKMDVKTAIYTRRSVRKYKSTPVPKQLVLELLEAANLAPSATNRQPWEFVVVNRSYLDRLEDTLKEAFHDRVASVTEEAMRRAIKDLSLPEEASGDRLKALGAFYRTLGGAPVAIGVCLPKEEDPWLWKNNISDSAAAIENLLLAAWDQGLGTCWMTGPLKGRADAIASFLGVPEDRELVAIVTLGYPDHQPPVPPKKDVARKTRWIGFE